MSKIYSKPALKFKRKKKHLVKRSQAPKKVIKAEYELRFARAERYYDTNLSKKLCAPEYSELLKAAGDGALRLAWLNELAKYTPECTKIGPAEDVFKLSKSTPVLKYKGYLVTSGALWTVPTDHFVILNTYPNLSLSYHGKTYTLPRKMMVYFGVNEESCLPADTRKWSTTLQKAFNSYLLLNAKNVYGVKGKQQVSARSELVQLRLANLNPSKRQTKLQAIVHKEHNQAEIDNSYSLNQ